MKSSPQIAVSAIIKRDDCVALVKRADEPNAGLWSFPGGKVKFGERLEDAVRREVLEETCLAVEVGCVASVREIVPQPGQHDRFHYVIILYEAKAVSGEIRAGSDAKDAQWIALTDLDQYSLTPGLGDIIHNL